MCKEKLELYEVADQFTANCSTKADVTRNLSFLWKNVRANLYTAVG